MGPLLFIIYINDIIFSSDIFKCIMYADDTTLFATIKCTDENRQIEIINADLSKVNEWLLANKMSLNVVKTKFMVFSMPQRKVTPIQLRIADNEIEGVDLN